MGIAPVGAAWLRESGPEEVPAITGQLRGSHLLAPVLSLAEGTVTDQLRVAATLARGTGGTLSVVDPTDSAPGAPAAKTVDPGDDATLLERALDGVDSTRGTVSTPGVVREVLSAVRSLDVDTLVLPGASHGGLVRAGLVDRIAAHADCDTIVVNGRVGYEPPPSILLPIAGGRHSGLAADLAGRVAAVTDAWIDVLHVVPDDASGRRREAAREYVEAARDRIDRDETTSTWVLEAGDVVDAVIEQSRYYGLTVIGAPTKGRFRRFVGGSRNRTIRKSAGSVVLSARDNGEAGAPE